MSTHFPIVLMGSNDFARSYEFLLEKLVEYDANPSCTTREAIVATTHLLFDHEPCTQYVLAARLWPLLISAGLEHLSSRYIAPFLIDDAFVTFALQLLHKEDYDVRRTFYQGMNLVTNAM